VGVARGPYNAARNGSLRRREMLFLSHANPEDNVVTNWLALRLAAEGYAVWCDLTRLLGGEAFWDDIQSAIEERTAKFLYIPV
jgi:TIR domain